jgi:hypothetical protein
VVANAEIEAELGVGPQRPGLDLVQILDEIQGPQAPAASSARRSSGTRTSL